jgi:tRNA(adenine34) deaminase
MPSTRREHDSFMMLAVLEARDAQERGEAPFGCIIVNPDNHIIGRASGTHTALDPIRHSEVVAIQQACLRSRGRPEEDGALLQGCTIYSTHEPCAMCCGAINHAKLSTVVFGSFRSDLPTLFRPYNTPVTRRLRDTSHPPRIDVALRRDCVHLFDRWVQERRELDMWVGP